MSAEKEMRIYAQLRQLIDPWERLGSRRYSAGTWRIGHIPHVAPEGYLHGLFPPLSKEDIDDLQDAIEYDLPHSVVRFLKLHNGIGIFSYIRLYGLRTSYERSDVDAMMEQPYDLVSLNTWERPKTCPDDFVLLGSTGDDCQKYGSWPNGEIHMWNENEEIVEQKAASDIFEFLLMETQKRKSMYDADGVRIDGSDAHWIEFGEGVAKR